jgi:hypothetical protein
VGSLSEWISAFRELHERARRGALAPGEQNAYRAGRDELARALLAAQRLTLKSGETPRQALRVARALQLELDLATSRQRSVTIDLSTGGFSTLLDKAPPVGDDMGVSLRLPAADPVVCRARVTDVRPQAGHVRVAARFEGMPTADRERLELFVFDTVLAQLVR